MFTVMSLILLEATLPCIHAALSYCRKTLEMWQGLPLGSSGGNAGPVRVLMAFLLSQDE